MTLRAKRDRLAAGLTAAGFDVLPTQGTYFLNADAGPLGERDAAALCTRLAHEAGVVAIPMSAFSADPDGQNAVDRALRLLQARRGDRRRGRAAARLGRRALSAAQRPPSVRKTWLRTASTRFGLSPSASWTDRTPNGVSRRGRCTIALHRISAASSAVMRGMPR